MHANDPAEPTIDTVIARVAELEEALAGRRERLCVLAGKSPESRADALRRMKISLAIFEFRTLVEIREGLAALAAPAGEKPLAAALAHWDRAS